MKTIVYILLIIGAVMLATSKDLRVKATNVLKMLRENVDRHAVRGDHAEIRTVKAADFDSVTNEPGRLVVVVIDQEIKTSKTESHALDDEFKEKLPGKVLIARISSERSSALLRRLGVTTLPHIRIYQQGELLEHVRGKVSTSKLIDTIQYHLGRASPSLGSGSEDFEPMSR